jgi:crotonobetainyl-CoA:carnitine CoA-transferase CaiB-like acyl-CoA transferase
MGALEGIRVLDFGQYLAGPLVAMMLADQGADVIRIDPPGGPFWSHPANAILQRGQRSVVLDLKTPVDATEARRLAENTDILIENFRPGVMARLGFAPDALLAHHPRLIYCWLPGFASEAILP